jgi:hypothetical protein
MKNILEIFKTPVTIICLLMIVVLVIAWVCVAKHKDCASALSLCNATKQLDGFQISVPVKGLKGSLDKFQVFLPSSIQKQHCQCIVVFAEEGRCLDTSVKPRSDELFPCWLHCFDCKDFFDNKGD